jgi:hypothetical protein
MSATPIPPHVAALAAYEAAKHRGETTRPTIPWPDPLGAEAYHGIVGDFLRLVAPASEADPAALLSQFLVMTGCCIGAGPHGVAGADVHSARLFAVIVGATSRGRKGAAAAQVRRVLHEADPEWSARRVLGGLSTGEGLVWAVRDPIFKTEAVKVKGKCTGETQEVLVDEGESDKRCLCLESEFSRTLKVAERDGSTLTAIVRQAWDSGDLRVMTRSNTAMATGAHISIIGHITADELRRDLTSTEVANGLANRFLWVAARRSKLLPDGGAISERDLTALSRSLGDRITQARTIGEVHRSPDAAELWREVYPELTNENVGGLLGAVTARAEAQVLRLSVLYAILDGSRVIDPAHLAAALEVWRYCEDSARFIFGDSLGDPVADEILHALGTSPDGLTRNDIRELFSRNLSSGRIGAALAALQRAGRVIVEVVKDTGGRPAERWKLAPLPDAVNAIDAERGV